MHIHKFFFLRITQAHTWQETLGRSWIIGIEQPCCKYEKQHSKTLHYIFYLFQYNGMELGRGIKGASIVFSFNEESMAKC